LTCFDAPQPYDSLIFDAESHILCLCLSYFSSFNAKHMTVSFLGKKFPKMGKFFPYSYAKKSQKMNFSQKWEFRSQKWEKKARFQKFFSRSYAKFNFQKAGNKIALYYI
jgi:hypothetical protein